MHIIAPRAQALNASIKLCLSQTRSYPRHHILPSHLLLEKIAKRFISITVQKMADYYHQQRGTIHLIIGPMFSGKTTELFRLVQRHTLAGRQVAIIKYRNDTRYDVSQACTHDRRKMKAITAENIEEVYEKVCQYDVIGIDEGQFFKDLVKYAQDFANAGKTVIIAALNGDYRQQPFNNVTLLMPVAEKIEKLSAVCACGQSASFTFRMNESRKIEVIGGEELYRALCRDCLIQYQKAKELLKQSRQMS